MKHTILLADDSVTIQKVVELTFLDEEVRVVSVGNGSDALARLGEVRPDLVLADVHMPGADGYEVCAAARQMLPGVPVMLLVGTFELFDADRAAQVGAAGHLKKPFDSQELLRRVRELLAAGRTQATDAGESWVPETPGAAPAFEPPPWEPEPPPVEPGASDAAEGDSWSFEPVGEPEGAAEMPIVPAAGESWSALATPRSEAATPPEPTALAREPEPEPLTAPEPAEVASPAAPSAGIAAVALTEADLERLARRVAELLSERAVKEVAWEVVPDLAEVLLKARIRELEAAVE